MDTIYSGISLTEFQESILIFQQAWAAAIGNGVQTDQISFINVTAVNNDRRRKLVEATVEATTKITGDNIDDAAQAVEANVFADAVMSELETGMGRPILTVSLAVQAQGNKMLYVYYF